MRMQEYEFWFVVGSQFLYGPEVLETVARRAAEMADLLNASGNLPCRMVYKVTAKTNQEIADVVREANYDPRCAGIITWCHTFSPSKMWINGFVNLQKPYCHFATQYNREIPNEEIDMDFMNLNQAAHGDREHGFLAAWFRFMKSMSISSVRRQHARSGRDRGRQGGGPGQAGLAGQHLGRGRPGPGDERGHRRRD